MNNDKPLSTIITAEAKIAMPDVVAIFLSKYETELIDQKRSLQTKVLSLKKELEVLDKTAVKTDKFKKHVGLSILKLDITSYISEAPRLNWDTESIIAVIGLRNKKGYSYKFAKQIETPILPIHFKAYRRINNEIDTNTRLLEETMCHLSDMPRKERQIKARISELRLQEQGLEGFLADSQMQKLIQLG